METLTLNKEFKRVYNKGKSVVNPYFVVYALKNKYNLKRGCGCRIGITATKKVGKAVQRNRARRVLREAYRTFYKTLPAEYDFVFVARTRILQAKTTAIIPLMKRDIQKILNS